MVRLIMGVKGSGKTKRLIDMTNDTAKNFFELIVCFNTCIDLHNRFPLD